MTVNVVVLAGGKNSAEMKEMTGVENRALTPLGDRAMLDYVTSALSTASTVGSIYVVGDVPASSHYHVVAGGENASGQSIGGGKRGSGRPSAGASAGQHVGHSISHRGERRRFRQTRIRIRRRFVLFLCAGVTVLCQVPGHETNGDQGERRANDAGKLDAGQPRVFFSRIKRPSHAPTPLVKAPCRSPKCSALACWHGSFSRNLSRRPSSPLGH